MILRNFPLLLLALMFIALGSVIFMKAPERPLTLLVAEEELEPEQTVKSFTGRMVMPSVDDIYVLDNSAGRDLLQFERFLQGRAAGLHWVASDHFRNEKAAAKHHKNVQVKDVYMGLKLTVDSLGTMTPSILFCNSTDQDFTKLVLQHIGAYWKYPRGVSGKFEVWVPVVWRANWK